LVICLQTVTLELLQFVLHHHFGLFNLLRTQLHIVDVHVHYVVLLPILLLTILVCFLLVIIRFLICDRSILSGHSIFNLINRIPFKSLLHFVILLIPPISLDPS
jgi:hypothetical protein